MSDEHTIEKDARTTLDYLEGLSARSRDGRLRDAIALVRSAVWDDLDARDIPPAE